MSCQKSGAFKMLDVLLVSQAWGDLDAEEVSLMRRVLHSRGWEAKSWS
jgi:hypothetical protein